MKRRALVAAVAAIGAGGLALLVLRFGGRRSAPEEPAASGPVLTAGPPTRHPDGAAVARRPAATAGPALLAAPRPEATSRPPRDLSDRLRPAPPWPGPWPASIAEVTMTPSMRERVEDYGGRSSVDQTLQFLSGMRDCLSAYQVQRPGGLVLHLSYAVDYDRGTMTAVDVVPEQSVLSEEDDHQVLECARRLHLGKVRAIGPATRAALNGAREYEWRLMLNVPVENDRFYPWLLTD